MKLIDQIRMGNFINEVSKHPTKPNEIVLGERRVTPAVFKEMAKETDQSNFSPITLTEEWMKKLGLGKNSNGQWQIEIKEGEQSIIIFIDWDERMKMFAFQYNRFRTRHFSEVHDFQNFWFAHFKRELEYKEQL